MTHKVLADRLGVSLTTVAIVREVVRATSEAAQQARISCDGDLIEAARWLASLRRCYRVAREITPELIEAIVEADREEP